MTLVCFFFLSFCPFGSFLFFLRSDWGCQKRLAGLGWDEKEARRIMPVGPSSFCKSWGRRFYDGSCFCRSSHLPLQKSCCAFCWVDEKCGESALSSFLLGATTQLAPFGEFIGGPWSHLKLWGYAMYPLRTGSCRGDINIREYVTGQERARFSQESQNEICQVRPGLAPGPKCKSKKQKAVMAMAFGGLPHPSIYIPPACRHCLWAFLGHWDAGRLGTSLRSETPTKYDSRACLDPTRSILQRWGRCERRQQATS